MVNLNGLLFSVSNFVSITGCLKVYFRIQFSYNKWIEEREKIKQITKMNVFHKNHFKIKAKILLKLIIITLAT